MHAVSPWPIVVDRPLAPKRCDGRMTNQPNRLRVKLNSSLPSAISLTRIPFGGAFPFGPGLRFCSMPEIVVADKAAGGDGSAPSQVGLRALIRCVAGTDTPPKNRCF